MTQKKQIGRAIGCLLLACSLLFIPCTTPDSNLASDTACFASGGATRRVRSNANVASAIPQSVEVLRQALPAALCPGGMPFGVKLHTKGVLVVGVSQVETPDGNRNPSYDAGLRVGDVILKINQSAVEHMEEVTRAVTDSRGEPLLFTVRRENREYTFRVIPVATADGTYKAGLWIKDSTAGIGTVTFVMPETGGFAGLGHGICDGDTGELMPFSHGTVLDVTLTGVVRGASGKPGELKGYFEPGKRGKLLANTRTGVYGVFLQSPKQLSEQVPVAAQSEIREGEAEILSSVDESGVRSYRVRISRISDAAEYKNFVVEVTDPALLAATGGIVQGMSGSPVIQNGKLIGAVTHVLIGDPTKGYGIYIGNMLANLPSLLQ